MGRPRFSVGYYSSSSSKRRLFSATLRQKWNATMTTIGLTSAAPVPSATIPADNIFVPIEPNSILPQIPIGSNHPVPRTGIEDSKDKTMHTNKFYANAFLGQQNQPIWTQPYSIWWGKGQKGDGVFETWGMNVAHIEESELVFGEGDPARHYINPRKISVILSARDLESQTTLTTDTHLPFSVNININQRQGDAEPKITFPVVQGMSFVTASYRDALPIIQCPGGIRDFSGPVSVGKSTKYRMKDADQRDWVIYVNPVPDLAYDPALFTKTDDMTVAGPPGFKGTIQIAKNPLGPDGESLYDEAAGTFVTEALLTGTVNDAKGTYSLAYTKIGTAPLLMFCLPHHIQSLDPQLSSQVTKLQLRTTTKGVATAVLADQLTFIEPNLPITMGFAPWTPTGSSTKARYPTELLPILAPIAEEDLQRAIKAETPSDSFYFAGKQLAKLATIIWIAHDVLANPTLAATGLTRLKSEMKRYISNTQKIPLYYDDVWKGIVSHAGFADPNADFGNTYYNDHHFHFGYFVYAAAVIGYLEPEWLDEGDNKAWTQMLVKDFAESEYEARDYPFSRAFDWWNGHSWAKGLYESADGKDQESTSEDAFAAFALKMWGKVIGDAAMEKRGNLMLAIQTRSFNNYFYLQSNNTNHPARFIKNSVTGILFENKVDHVTYFGLNKEYIHGIHMLPLSPPTALTRPKPFVREEWDRWFAGPNRDNAAANVPGGWRGVLYANLALVDAKAAWDFFKNGHAGEWKEEWIDGGASRSWYLVWCAAFGGGVGGW